MALNEYSLSTNACRMDSLIVSFVFRVAINLFFVCLVAFMSFRNNCIGGMSDVKVTCLDYWDAYSAVGYLINVE